MKKLLLIALCSSQLATAAGLLAVDNPANMNRSELYAELDAYAANDMVPLKELSGRWDHYTPATGKNLALGMARAELGAQSAQPWGIARIAVIAREDWRVEGNRDTMDLVWQDRNRKGLDAGRSYVLDYKLDGFSANGLKAGWANRFALAPGWDLALGTSASLLKANNYRIDHINGIANATASNAFTAILNRDHAYWNMNTSPANFNPFVPAGEPSGRGYAVDFGLTLLAPGDIRFEATLADALGEIRWKQMPRTRIQANNASVSYNAAGDRNAIIAGTDSRETINERLHTKLDWTASMPLAPASLPGLRGQLGDAVYRGNSFPRIGLEYPFDSAWGTWNTSLEYDTRFKSTGIKIGQRYFSLAVVSDSISLDRAKTYGLHAALRYPF